MLFKLGIEYGFLFLQSKRDKHENSLHYGVVHTPKVGPVNYHVQLIGGTQKRVVHRNRLKPCLSDPEPESDVEIKNPEPSSSKQVTPEDNNTHMEVVQDMTLPEVLEDETVIPVEDTILENEDHVVNVENHQLDARKRNRQPPQRYGD